MKLVRNLSYFTMAAFLFLAALSFSSCAAAYNKLSGTTYVIEIDESGEEDGIIGGIKWEFSSEKYPYVGETGNLLTISEYGEFTEEYIKMMLEAGFPVPEIDTKEAIKGCWRVISPSKLYVCVVGASQIKQEYSFSIDDASKTLTLENDTNGTIVLTKKE